jgi:hypothetical protein
MTPVAAVKLGEELLAHLGVKGWRVEAWPIIGSHPMNRGLCDYDRRLISLSECSGGCSFETVVHEVAHVLASWCNHNPVWEAAVEHIRPLAELLARE